MKKHLLIILLLTIFGLSVNAQCTSSQGANSGSVFVNDASIGTYAWSQPQQAQSSDNVYATCSFLSPGVSRYLKETGFGFSIPTTASICGIEVKLERSRLGSFSIRDNAIRVVKNDTVTGTNYASNLPWGSTDSIVTYGSNPNCGEPHGLLPKSTIALLAQQFLHRGTSCQQMRELAKSL